MDKKLEEQINYLLSLGDNWDEEGAVKIERSTITKALEYIPLIKSLILEKAELKLEDDTPRPKGRGILMRAKHEALPDVQKTNHVGFQQCNA